ncbi:uncharacterized protein JN550_013240 [Neoarthrinium moseri]|uniref:uncharacterized protein n=1 Tax=Neoarthrinium moseri TaxID=1658444 RepID=UPI001FDC5D98|nr:uncharacterized protein JN550_013240 [Neoarthrinium moseri]KAI1857360.1 hypothetical protein JN550_013240 [Neoarthrinium moseri]
MGSPNSMAPLDPNTGRHQYPADRNRINFRPSRPDFVAARRRCNDALSKYNAFTERCSDEERVRLWLNVVDPARVRQGLPRCLRSQMPDPAVDPRAHDKALMEYRGCCVTEPNDAAGFHTEKLVLGELGMSNSDNCVMGEGTAKLAQQRIIPDIKPGILMEYGLRVRIHPTVGINYHCTIIDSPVADIDIGPHVLIGPHVKLFSVGHSLASDEAGDRTVYAGPITIEAGVWVGGNSTILSGVTIGEGAVISAGSVVTKDIPPYSVAVGSPARVLRYINAEEDGPQADDYEAQTLVDALMVGGTGDPTGVQDALTEARIIGKYMTPQNQELYNNMHH